MKPFSGLVSQNSPSRSFDISQQFDQIPSTAREISIVACGHHRLNLTLLSICEAEKYTDQAIGWRVSDSFSRGVWRNFVQQMTQSNCLSVLSTVLLRFVVRIFGMDGRTHTVEYKDVLNLWNILLNLNWKQTLTSRIPVVVRS